MKKTIIISAVFVALILSGVHTQSLATDKVISNESFLIQEKDPGLELESWMLDNKYWSEETDKVQKPDTLDEEQEQPLELESWMLDNSYWN